MIIRKASIQDFPQIFSLIKAFAAFQQTPGKLTITLEQMIEEKDLFKCFIAENNDKEIVGFASYFFAYYSWSGKAIYLDDLYVKEDHQNQGIGTQLLKEVITLAKIENCKKLRWQVSRWNDKAIKFYQKMGAALDDVEMNCDLLLS